MKSIRNKFLYFFLGAVLSTVMTVFLIHVSVIHAIIIMSILTAVFVVSAFKTLKSYQEARLICENPILNVGIASVSKGGNGAAESTVSVVVSGFGILLDDKPYKFGHSGVLLKNVTIDRDSIALSFGQDENSYSVSLLHGITELNEIKNLTERLKYETGVITTINEW